MTPLYEVSIKGKLRETESGIGRGREDGESFTK